MPKKMITAFVLVFSLLIPGAGLGFIPIGVADLNDGLEKHLEPPIISIWSPLNQTHGTDVFLNFSISRPESWLSTPVSLSYETGSGLAQKLLSVTYSIDEEIHGPFSLNSNLSSPFNYSIYLGNLTVGEHSLKVWANATGVVRNWISDQLYSVPISSVSLVNLAIDSINSTPQPRETGSFPIALTVSVAAVALFTVTSLLVYQKKHKPQE